jgi:hypothetical protein
VAGLEYGGPSAGDGAVVKVAPGMTDAAYVRLRVVAARRRSAAEDVEVMILRARVPDPTDDVELNPEYQPTGDIALDGQLLAWSNADGATRLTIPPATYRHLDLVRVLKPVRGSVPALAPVQIQVEPQPVDGRHNVKGWRVDLELAVTARNTDARRYRVVVKYDGAWGDDIWQHLHVDEPRRLDRLRDRLAKRPSAR